jgi:prevent-host-death family protein
MTATEAARTFSDVLSRVAAGEEIEIVRNGAPVAVITPPRVRFVPADRFRDLLESAPSVDEAFADDLRAIREELGPPENAWRS